MDVFNVYCARSLAGTVVAVGISVAVGDGTAVGAVVCSRVEGVTGAGVAVEQEDKIKIQMNARMGSEVLFCMAVF